ncbi:helix-turn-helix transcriptional regulator [Zoogloea sp.]|uniref:helix-turn-helix domain-containing protein n=1 Tax=Zoogloea sp. TaxID=49181 RepID=UPI00345A9E44
MGSAVQSDQAFGRVVRELRQRKRLSQEKLAFAAGLDRNYISLIELGKNSASVKTIFKLCTALGVRPSELFELVESGLEGD